MMEKVTMIDLFGTDLKADRAMYQFQVGSGHKRRNPDGDGVIIEVTIPAFTGTKTFFVNNRLPADGPMTDGVLSYQAEVFGDKDPIDKKIWGQTGMMRVSLQAPRDIGLVLYIGQRPHYVKDRKPNWISELNVGWR
jgi:hypothetical protein